jgi:hypothetical protein
MLARQPVLVAAAAVALVATPAQGDKPRDPDAIDRAAVARDLQVLTDGSGHYVAISMTERDKVFYGDGKVFHLQSQIGAGAHPPRYSWVLWAPQSPRNAHLEYERGSGKGSVDCAGRETPLHLLDEADTRKLLDGARFRKPLWKRQALVLSRDEAGRYYYADRLRDEHGGRGFRLFIGKKGRLVEQKLIDTVADSAGFILETRQGQLVVDLGKQAAQWVAGKKKEPLIFVPPADNRTLIYGDLGVYRERFGVLCDDF